MQNDVDSPTGPTTARRGRYQYSLSTLLLFATIIALVCKLCESCCELQRTKAALDKSAAEVKKYRHEMGYLEITDPTEVYWRPFRNNTPRRWSWRVYLPQNRQFWIGDAEKQIPGTGLPDNHSRCTAGPVGPGELLVEATAEKGHDGKCRLYVSVDGNELICGEEMPSLEDTGYEFHSRFSLGEEKTDEVRLDPDQPLVLLRLRAAESQKGFRRS